MLVYGGSVSQQLATRISKAMSEKPGEVEIKRFPDGETYIRVHDNVKGQDVAVVQSFYPPPDQKIFETLLLIDTLRDLGANMITTIIPYLAYTRQDSRFYPGEALTSVAIARFLESAGATNFFTVDCHLHRMGDVSKVFKIPATNLSAMPVLGHYASKMLKPKKPIVVAPDEEAEQWAGVVAKELDTEHVAFKKVRTRKEGETKSTVAIDTGDVELKGRDVVFADDMISTGGTIATAAKACRKNGARRIFALCTHPVLADGAMGKLRSAGVLKIIGTDTIPSPVSKVSVAPVIAESLENLTKK